MLNTHKLAREKAIQDNQPLKAWEIALNRAASLHHNGTLSEKALLRLTEAAKGPQQILVFCDYVGRNSDPSVDPFMELGDCIDDNRYSLGDWLKAMQRFHHWILANKRATAFKSMLGYLHCCAEIGSNQPTPPDLPELVASMLEQYGFDD